MEITLGKLQTLTAKKEKELLLQLKIHHFKRKTLKAKSKRSPAKSNLVPRAFSTIFKMVNRREKTLANAELTAS